VIAQHYAWAHEAGIDVFFASWDGAGSYSDRTISGDLLPSPARGSTQVALLYESRGRFPLAADGRIHLDPAGVDRLVSDFDAIGREYFGRPGYFEIGGRPVVVDFVVHRDAMVWPMVAAGTGNDDIKVARDMAPDWDVTE